MPETPSDAAAGSPADVPRRSARSFWLVVLLGGASAAIGCVTADEEAAPASLALGLVSLAAWGAILVLRRRGRRFVAFLGWLAAVGGVAACVLDAPDAVACGVALAVSAVLFVVAFRKAPNWPEMSQRYDAPDGGGSKVPSDPWKAIDEGHDPTV